MCFNSRSQLTLNLLLMIMLYASVIHCQNQATTRVGYRVGSAPRTPGPHKIVQCKYSTSQSPINIAKRSILLKKTSRMARIISMNDSTQTFIIKMYHNHIIGFPTAPMYITGTPLSGSYDLYSFHLYPRTLHTVEGMDIPELEYHLKFIYNLAEHGTAFDHGYLSNAARNNRLVNVVQLVTLLRNNETYPHKKDMEDFINCARQIVTQEELVCDMILNSMVVDFVNAGYYYYLGSLMYPSCEEIAKYIILHETLKVSAEHAKALKDMAPNFIPRSQQPLNNRWVTLYTKSLGNWSVTSTVWILVFGCMWEMGM